MSFVRDRSKMLVKPSSYLVGLLLLLECFLPVHGLLSPSLTSSATHILEHLTSPPLPITPLEDLTNTRIPGPSGVELLAFVATPDTTQPINTTPTPVLILIHEFFGLNPSIVDKAKALAEDLNCVVIAPDTFRGAATDFVPRAIWLALSTPQNRVNDDLDAVCDYVRSGNLPSAPGGVHRLAVMGFCYGGGKAVRYTTQRRGDAATVVCYGKPVTDVEELMRLRAPVCGVFGREDGQFPIPLVDEFRRALGEAGVESDVRVYDGVGHAFWKDMGQVRRGDEPQAEAYKQCTDFLRGFFG